MIPRLDDSTFFARIPANHSLVVVVDLHDELTFVFAGVKHVQRFDVVFVVFVVVVAVGGDKKTTMTTTTMTTSQRGQ